MTENIDFRDLWKRKEIKLPDIADILKRINEYKVKRVKEIALSNLVLILTGSFIILIWKVYKPQLTSTKIGIIIILFSIAFYLILYNRLIPLLFKIDEQQSNAVYLHNLLILKEKQRKFHSIITRIYYFFLSLGISLYMYEYTLRMNDLWAAFTYGITLIWIGSNFFYFAPRAIERRTTRLNELITKFRKLTNMIQDQK